MLHGMERKAYTHNKRGLVEIRVKLHLPPAHVEVTAHSFRHTFATLQASAVSQNPFLLKEILGHCQLSTTERYCHPRQMATVIDVTSFVGGVTPGCEPEKQEADPVGSASRKAM